VTATTVLLVLAAGAVGSVLRAVAVDVLPRHGTTAVNLAGTLLLAATVALAADGRLGPGTAAVLGLGLSGSLTTFSGWVARIDAGLARAPVATLVIDVLVPLLAGVGLTVVAFVLLA
jgi:fluoride ion exporter CrcB/FEX